MKSKVIAISAISAGFIAIFLTIGAYFSIFDLVSVVIASVFVLLPTYYNSYAGSVLAFLAGGIIAFIFSSFNIMSIVFPSYIAFFGVYPIIKCKMAEKNFNKIAGLLIGLVWCVAVCFGIYFYYTEIMGQPFSDLPEFILNYILFFVALAGVVFYFLFDRFIVLSKLIIDRYLGKILKK